MESAILVGTHALDELRELATSAGARIIDEVIQHRDRPDPATFIGKGKVEELHEEVVVEGVDVVIFDDELSPGQAKNLEEALDTKVVDRTALSWISSRGVREVKKASFRSSWHSWSTGCRDWPVTATL